MVDGPWLTIVGLSEDGAEGLSPASRRALDAAQVLIGPERHLALVPKTSAERVVWPRPFADGLELLEDLRGRRVVALVSGDPFWFGAGRVIAEQLSPAEWSAHPAPSTFSLAAARLGWSLEATECFGLHAAPLTRLAPALHDGARLLVLLRDGAAAAELAVYLAGQGFGASRVTLMEALGGPRERVRAFKAAEGAPDDAAHPVCAAVAVHGGPSTLHLASGQADTVFDHDGQITKRPMRALTLSALRPTPGARLWDIGAGSGSIAIEWLLSSQTAQATAIEAKPDRAARIRANADRLGCDRLGVVTGVAPHALEGLPDPDVVFIGGGLSGVLLEALWARLSPGVRVVASAVTLESEALLAEWQGRVGGDLMRIDLATSAPLGGKRGWKAAYPVVQWSVER